MRKQIEDLELEIDRVRRENGRRREVISKKEIGVMERAKKSQKEKAANQREQERVEAMSEFVIQEEERVDKLVRQLQRREMEEIPQRRQMIEAKRAKMIELKET